MNPYVNIHTHHAGEGINILDVGEGNTWIDRENQREPETGQEVFYSVGIHPMKLEEVGEDALACIEDTIQLDKVIAIGECGLDRRSPFSIEEQGRILEAQVALAERYRKPLIIHCVKAYSELIAIRGKTKSTVPWIIHGFNNNEQILQQLLGHGFHVSVGAALLNARSNAFHLIRQVPADRLFLENDDKEIEIGVIYEAAAGVLGLDVEELKRMMLENYKKVFAIK